MYGCGRRGESCESRRRRRPSPPVTCDSCVSTNAYVYCEVDEAFLCEGCDGLIHGASFDMWRHFRRILCHTCQDFTRCVRVEQYLIILPPLGAVRPRTGIASPLVECDAT